MSRTTASKLDSLLQELSKIGLSKSELSKFKESYEDPIVGRKLSSIFENPITARKLLESFEVPVFRKEFFDDPIIAVEKISR